MLDEKIGRYDRNNLRFRRAYIRERLLEFKAERDALVAERDLMTDMIVAKAAKMGTASDMSHAEPWMRTAAGSTRPLSVASADLLRFGAAVGPRRP